MKKVLEIFEYREMIRSMVMKSLSIRYKGSILGFLWTFANPLLQLLVYSFVFSIIMKTGIDNFPMFLFTGLIPWTFFSGSIMDASTCIMANSSLVKKIYFPKLVVPISVVTANFINMLFGFIVVFIALYVNDIELNGTLIYLPLIYIIQFVFTLAVTNIISCVSVYFRDMQQIVGILSMMWFYFTPIIYDLSFVPEDFKGFMLLNPMTHLVVAYRKVLYYASRPDFNSLFVVMFISSVLLIISFYIFEKLERNFAEEL